MRQIRLAVALILLVLIAGSVGTAMSVSSLVEPPYAAVLRAWETQYQGAEKDLVLSPSPLTATRKFTSGDTLAVEVQVPRTGLYSLAFDYYTLDNSILPPELAIRVNGVYPFYEARRIILPNLWSNQSKEINFDRYGNELTPRSVKVQGWQHRSAYDGGYLFGSPLLFLLNQGTNMIELKNVRGVIILGSIYLTSPQKLLPYAESAHKLDDYPSQSPSLVKIEAEKMLTRNDSSIRLKSHRDPAVTPYDTHVRYLNTIDGESFSKGGQEITWSFSVPESGLYKIAFKYQQSSKPDLPVFRRIGIDGQVPWEELDNYPFHFAPLWDYEVLSSGDGEPFLFHLDEGMHTISLMVNLGNVQPVVTVITEIMQEINELSLQIKRLTGNRKDPFRDWSIAEYIPDVDSRLLGWADRLEDHYGKLNELNPHVSEIGALVNLKMSFTQLRKLAREPNEIPNRMEQLSQGSSSVAELLGTLLGSITESPLSLDAIYIFHEQELPPARASLPQRLRESVARFFSSFRNQQYAIGEKEEGVLDVWVNRARPFVELMQQMIDETFTPQNGVEVRLSLMPDEGKLILARASGGAPDVALGVSNWLPYELAVRGGALDLRQFSGFTDLAGFFSPGALIPFAYGQGIYALPETQDFWVLFYRKDILQALNIPLPQTWDDVIDILPELQRFGMNFATPLATFGGFKPFTGTTPFLYQWGGELYSLDGMSTAIDSEQALDAMRFMTELFTIYNMPEEVPNFYHHFRYGTLPVGIANFHTYVQLRTAAPEIANSWSLAPHPGRILDGELVRWAQGSGQTAMILDQTKQPGQSWEFLEWWLGIETQIEFAHRLQSLYGETYLWNTANLEAFKELPWPSEHKEVILEQFAWVREPSRVPGGYMLERELSNIWNRIVFDGENPRTTMDDAVIRVNRETARKMEEFGFTSYLVPTITNIEGWMKSHE